MNRRCAVKNMFILTGGIVSTRSIPLLGRSDSLQHYMQLAWDVSWVRFYDKGTQQFYDYLTSYRRGRGLAHLPTTEEVLRQYPNVCGYGTGMEDCMISAGIMIGMVVDKYAVTKEDGLRRDAFYIFKGIQRSATLKGAPGFVARGICVEDMKSYYINSSRDQYTHTVHGLWHYYHSPLCDRQTQSEIGKILSAIADRMEKYVTPDNGYDSMRADGSHDTIGISKMWDVMAHEAARLPMIYAAAWDTTKNAVYYTLYRKYIKQAIDQSFAIEERVTTYALLQMQCSMELLGSLETDEGLKNKIEKIKELVASKSVPRAIKAYEDGKILDLSMLGSDWRRLGGGLDTKGVYRKVWYCIRESGEAALTQLLFPEYSFTEKQVVIISQAIKRLDYHRVSSSGIFYLQAAYWKAIRRGIKLTS